MIRGSGRSAGEGIGYRFQYSWASLLTQQVKNLPSMQETWIGKIPWRSEQLSTPVFESGGFFGLYSPWGLKESGMTEQLSLHYEDELGEILGKSISGRGITNAKVLS